ncbi:MAG: glycosyltransferase [Lachnospiraceae bacterium]|nr:glycosyltransferase [Lachnospiraceae bacterium]
MKILISTDSYKYNISGVTAVVLTLCTGLRNLGHEVKTLSLSNSNRSFKDGDDYYIKSFPAFYYPDMRMSLAMHDPLLAELMQWQPDIIHAQSEGTTFLMALRIMKHCNIPVVMTCHTDYAYFIFGKYRDLPPVNAFMSAVGKGVYGHAVKVTVPSYKAKGFSCLHTLRDQLTVIPNGIELEKFRKSLTEDERREFRNSLGIGEDERVLVSVTRLSKEKNIREILGYLPALLQRCPGVKMLVVGDGPDREHLGKLTEELKLNDSVIFAGRIKPEEVWRYYSAGDLYVSASTFEVHSISFLEAMVNGLPLLCRNDEALRGVLVHNRNGFIYNTEEEFLDHAETLLCREELRKEMGQNSLKMVEAFSSQAFSASMVEVYRDAISEHEKS